jgi:hypothetical protein
MAFTGITQVDASVALTGTHHATLTSVLSGTAGNAVTFTTAAGGSGVGALTVIGTAYTFTYATGVTTMANLVTAVAGVFVVSGDTPSDVLASAGDTQGPLALTGGIDAAVIQMISDRKVRVAGLSLAAGASGTISTALGAGDVLLPTEFQPHEYTYGSTGVVVTLLESVEVSMVNSATPVGGASGDAAMFFGLTAGTGSAGTDYTATVAAGTPVRFPQNGPVAGSGIIRSAIATAPTGGGFEVTATGIYQVSWAVGTLESGELQLAILTAGPTYTPIANTTALTGAGTEQNTNTVLVSLTEGQSIALISAAGNTPALTIQTADGSVTHAQAPSLVISLVAGSAAAGIAVVKTGDDPTDFLITLTASATTPLQEIYVEFH